MNVASALSDARGRAWLDRLDPRLKLAWLLWISTLSMTLDSPPALGALFACSLLPLTGLRMRWSGWLAISGVLALAAWGELLSQAIFYESAPRTTWFTILPASELWGFRFPGLRIYREGVSYGLVQSLRLLSVSAAGTSVCLSTSAQRLLAALVRVRVPVSLAFLAVTALRFLPQLLVEIALVRQARRLRGYRGAKSTAVPWGARMRGEVALLTPVLALMLRRASNLAASVAARGFDPAAPRTFYPPLRMNATERTILSLLFLSCAAVLTMKGLFWLYLAELFYRPALRPLYEFARLWL